LGLPSKEAFNDAQLAHFVGIVSRLTRSAIGDSLIPSTGWLGQSPEPYFRISIVGLYLQENQSRQSLKLLQFFSIQEIISGCENQKFPTLSPRMPAIKSLIKNEFVKYPINTFFDF
jgi:hypothetical protein